MSKTRAWAAALVRSGLEVPHDLRSFGDDENEQIKHLIRFIMSATSASIKQAGPPKRPILPPGSRRTCWPAEQVRCSNNLNLVYNQPIDRNLTVWPRPKAADSTAAMETGTGVDPEVITIPNSDEADHARDKPGHALDAPEDKTTALAAGQAIASPEETVRSESIAQDLEPRSQIVFPMPDVKPASRSGRRSSSEPPAPPSQHAMPRKTAEIVRIDDQTTLFQDHQDASTPWPRGRAQEVKSRSHNLLDDTIEHDTRGDEVKPRMMATDSSNSLITA
ncbi:hypothetical protein FRC07_013450, partial [Ceratobasidium sp. 392]